MEAGEIITASFTLIAGGDLSNDQFAFVKADGTRAGLGEDAVGVIREPAAAGQPVGVGYGPKMKVKAGAATAAGVKVMADASGRAVLAVATAGRHVLGQTLTAAGAAGEIIEVAWQPEGILA